MRKIIYSLSMSFILASSGCGPTVSGSTVETDPDPTTQGGGGVAQIAGNSPSQQIPEEPATYEGPPHVFTPRTHPPRHRQTGQSAPNLRTLPKFKFRMNQCFDTPKRDRMGRGFTPRSSIATGSAGARSKSRRSKKPSKPSARPATKSATGPSGGGSLGAALQESAEESAKAAPSQAPSAPPSAEPEAKSKPIDTIATQKDEGPESQSIASHDDADDGEMGYDDWGAAIYLSNDDTMSLSSAQRVIYAIDNFLPLPSSHIRPHELLNYFSFDTLPVAQGNDFSVYGEIEGDDREAGIYTLGLSVDGRPVDKGSRRNAALTMVIDRSGSMRDEGRMDYLKRGLERMLDELKTGDMVHMVLFDHEVCVPAENFVVGRDDPRKLQKIIKKLKPRGATDLHRGLSRGYEIADRRYQSKFTNRVVMITDALTNTGVTNQEIISMISKYYDTRRIRLSGIGVGRNFNDGLLDRLTERGKGAYVFLGSEAEVDAVFGSRFISLIETTALDVHFRLHLPPSLRMNVFYGEESSTVKADVQEIHYFAGTSQLFLSDLMARGGTLRKEDGIMLTIEYRDPETGEKLVEETALALGDLIAQNGNVRKGRLIMAWVDMLAEMAAHPIPSHHYTRAASWQDPQGWQRCEDGKRELARLASGMESDPEVKRVLDLWDKHCARYERPRHPVKRQIPQKKDAWPGAK